jgi:hypothetical protein
MMATLTSRSPPPERERQSQAAPTPDYSSDLPAEVEVCGCDEALALRAEVARLGARVRELELARSPSRRAGVDWHAKSGKWRARALVAGKRVSLGVYPSEGEAASAVAGALGALRAKGASRG